MGKTFTQLDDGLRAFIQKQHLFFVASAPSGSEGHVNLSPKGLDSLRILDDTRIVYLDYPGSGAETIAHLRANGRIVLMFCAFEGPPKIVRIHGRGRTIEPQDDEFAALVARFTPVLPVRSIISIAIERIADSCGYAVPRMKFVDDRDQMQRWAERRTEAEVVEYQRKKNGASIDGLPALRWVESG